MDKMMTVMELGAAGEPLVARRRPVPTPAGHDVLIEVAACGVCRTDLHVVDGDIHATLPIVPGHEIVGRVAALGPDAVALSIGDRVGVPWLGGTCGQCRYCRSGRENLCDDPRFTGFTRDGGFASHVLADSRFCLSIAQGYDDIAAAPLLCAGLIGHRALKAAGEAEAIGFYGFGAAAHILAQLAVHEKRRVFAFTRRGDMNAQAFARALGCEWAGGSDEQAPEPLDAAIIFAPAGPLVPQALRAVRKGGRVVCAGIHMSDIPAFPYSLLWGERSICSVANLTRRDGIEFMQIAERVKIDTRTHRFALQDANDALGRLRAGEMTGAAVLVPG